MHKKSGNLRYGFANTSNEFIVILDADFVPRADFLAETLPYMDDPNVAIVQTPQFFRTDPRQTWVERAAGAVQEVFYRNIQVSRDRLGASICVGSSALYRRAALEPEGGTTLIAYAEDVHTGLDARRNGSQLALRTFGTDDRDVPGQLGRLRAPAVSLVHGIHEHGTDVEALDRPDDDSGAPDVYLRVFLLCPDRAGGLCRAA